MVDPQSRIRVKPRKFRGLKPFFETSRCGSCESPRICAGRHTPAGANETLLVGRVFQRFARVIHTIDPVSDAAAIMNEHEPISQYVYNQIERREWPQAKGQPCEGENPTRSSESHGLTNCG